MQHAGEHDDVGERHRLRERLEPVMETLARRFTLQTRPLRGQRTLKQSVDVHLLDRVLDRSAARNAGRRHARRHWPDVPGHDETRRRHQGVCHDRNEQQPKWIHVGTTATGGVLERQSAGMNEEQPQGSPQCAVEMQELVRHGVHEKMAQRERLGFQSALATS
jgi:hypothetical protein